MTDPSPDDPLAAFEATLAHAMRLHRKALLLDEQIRASIEVAGSIAEHQGIPRAALIDAVVMLREAKIPHRGSLGNFMGQSVDALKARRSYQPGTVHSLSKGDPMNRWPSEEVFVVYVLFDATDAAIYVGRSKNMRNRITGHGEKPWRRCEVHVCDDHAHSVTVESNTIRRYKPVLNKAGRW